MKCDMCGGNIVDVGVRGSFPDLNWNGEIHHSKEVYICRDCASIFWEGFSDNSPRIIEVFPLDDPRANIHGYIFKDGETQEVENNE